MCVNEGIRADLCWLVYSSVDNAIDVILELGPGSLLAKLDLESAYQNVPVHPTDRPLLGMVWEDALYIDTALPFGLRSAPKMFSALADGLIWMMGHRGVQRALHYLDDYLFFRRAGSQECTDALQVAVRVCSAVGMPVAMHKCEGSATSLGILIDMEKMEIRLPADKLSRLQLLINQWGMRKVCTKRDLLSLIGHLQHACKVVPSGRSFLRRMINTSTSVKELYHHVRLNREFRSDLLCF